MINPHWLEIPMSRTDFHGQAIKIRLYLEKYGKQKVGLHSQMIVPVLRCFIHVVLITKTCLYNFDPSPLNPLKPHFYIVKLEFTGINIIFFISVQKHRLWVLVEAVLTSAHNLYFEQKYERYQSSLLLFFF